MVHTCSMQVKGTHGPDKIETNSTKTVEINPTELVYKSMRGSVAS